MNILDPVAREADDISMDFIQRIVKEADGDQAAMLQLIDVALKASQRHQKRLKALRLETAAQMRGAGVPMTEIAEAANVNDSYISRLLIAAGGTRRVDRTRTRRRRYSEKNAGRQS